MQEKIGFDQGPDAPRVPAHVPTSAALARMIKDAPQDKVNLAWLLGYLQKRSFGFLILILALLGLVPGIAMFAGFLLAFPAIEMILAGEPHASPFPGQAIHFHAAYRTMVYVAYSVAEENETLIRPRWHTPFQATKRFVGFVVLVLAATIIWPFPFGYIVPSLAVMLISFAYLEEDGILLCISILAALLSLSFTAATVWATVEAAGPIGNLWTKFAVLAATAWGSVFLGFQNERSQANADRANVDGSTISVPISQEPEHGRTT